jgi:shikimate kinase
VVRIAFIGMSGAGKSHWTGKLAAAGFLAISIDDRIERKLGPELAADSHRGIGGVAAWMGWPDHPVYREHEGKYLAYEIESMREAFGEIEDSPEADIVLDTTGSVIYTGDEICRRMKKLTTVVYLAASPEEEKILVSRYLSDPKPVLWGDRFSQQVGESAREAIARCYPELIAHREKLYERLADRTIEMSRLRGASLDARGLLEILGMQARMKR